jgi:glycosyltransferase involved in cell wall biosynthesis
VAVKVSVVVPVYNPGRFIDRCITSLLGQTLPPEELDLIFVNDGSTDDTPARLDALAAAHSNVRVFHIPNSGWPGKPRNVGIAEASGEFVQFVDQDDWMADDALRRLYELGVRNSSDIILGKEVSNFRGINHDVFRHTVDRCSVHDSPIMKSLTPHKMFRTSWLRENGIAFPEGKRRLEDQLFLAQAYLAARNISILGDYVCYYYWRRDDKKNAGSTAIDPAGYYGNVREVIDHLIAHTEPGELRDELLRRPYRVEMLGRLGDPSVTRYKPEYLAQLVREIHKLADDYMTPSVLAGLRALLRVRAALLHADDIRGLVELGTATAGIRATGRVNDAGWEGDALRLSLKAELRTKGGGPLLVTRAGDRLLFDPRIALGFPADPVDITDEVQSYSAEVVVHNRDAHIDWPCTSDLRLDVVPVRDSTSARLVFRGTALLQPQWRGGREPLERGTWDVHVRVEALGLSRRRRLGSSRAPGVAEQCRPAALGAGPQIVIPYFIEAHDTLALDVDGQRKKLAPALARRPQTVRRAEGVDVLLDVATTPDTARSTADLVVTSSGEDDFSVTVPATTEPAAGRLRVSTDLRGAGIPEGDWWTSVRLDGPVSRPLPLGTLRVRRGRVRLRPRSGAADTLGRRTAVALGSVVGRALVVSRTAAKSRRAGPRPKR